ncbi:hypothetical protein [Roseibium marinum]|uniref:Uncharacterized protein n=1 Tax=Roseibium marinum TaxID=281252 RepID=A0A2S3ULI8_9HYPH|nr:hypothetical protein [Roseibium marinum]POF28430.1 hypothetical protein CLV41_114101 [Roseibium marinum]
MITIRKRILAVSTPTILGAVALTGALSAAELASSPSTAAETNATATIMAQLDVTAASGKGDLKIDLADAHNRPMRCVSGNNTTTCTGWPVAGGMLAFNAE